MDIGPQQAIGYSTLPQLPVGWTGRGDAPPLPPQWANINALSSVQVKNLLSQIAYNYSGWDYTKIGGNNELGRYQIGTTTLETYGLLAVGSNDAYNTSCVTYQHSWRPVTIRKNTNSYANYIYNITNMYGFLNSAPSQEHLAYQILFDLYNEMLQNGAILTADATDVVAGMLYVAWVTGAGSTATINNANGTGAYAWRFRSAGSGNLSSAYNSGRYAVTVLSQ